MLSNLYNLPIVNPLLPYLIFTLCCLLISSHFISFMCSRFSEAEPLFVALIIMIAGSYLYSTCSYRSYSG